MKIRDLRQELRKKTGSYSDRGRRSNELKIAEERRIKSGRRLTVYFCSTCRLLPLSAVFSLIIPGVRVCHWNIRDRRYIRPCLWRSVTLVRETETIARSRGGKIAILS